MSPCSRHAGAAGPCPPPQGQRVAGRAVCLMPALDATHSPVLSSCFGCLGEGSHAEQVSGAGHQLSLSQGLVLPWAHAGGL